MTNRKSRPIKIFAWTLAALAGIIVLALATALLAYPPEYVLRVFAWGESDVFDWQKFPEHPLEAAPTPFTFDNALDDRVPALFSELAGVDDCIAERVPGVFTVAQRHSGPVPPWAVRWQSMHHAQVCQLMAGHASGADWGSSSFHHNPSSRIAARKKSKPQRPLA